MVFLKRTKHTCTNPEVEETIDSELIKFMPKNSWDVGVDNNNYKPISIEEVLEHKFIFYF